MLLAIRHATRYAYEPAVRRAELRLRLFPATFESQAPLQWQVAVNGEPISAWFTNGYGDSEAIWRSREDQSEIEIVAEGVVETTNTSGIVRGLHDRTRPAMFLRQTELTAPNDAIRALSAEGEGVSLLERLHALSATVSEAVAYTQDATHAATSAAEALAHGKGVCQDHAHVFISAARCLKVPARYVTGYISGGFEGRHETHAWAEAFVQDLGWVGFDPSNRQSPTDEYVRLCGGFDAADAAPLRGWVSAAAKETLAVEVDVTPAIEQAQQ
jgi:transglutaminase-like putative cysteine protease